MTRFEIIGFYVWLNVNINDVTLHATIAARIRLSIDVHRPLSTIIGRRPGIVSGDASSKLNITLQLSFNLNHKSTEIVLLHFPDRNLPCNYFRRVKKKLKSRLMVLLFPHLLHPFNSYPFRRQDWVTLLACHLSPHSIHFVIFIITTIYINSGLSADVADRVWPRLLSFYFSLLYTPFL